MDIWDPADEKIDDIIGKLLLELHQVDQIFYHWSWYIFPRVLEFYDDPHHKLRFLFKYAIEINATDHSWDNLLDCPTKISLSRRPRPIIQEGFQTDTGQTALSANHLSSLRALINQRANSKYLFEIPPQLLFRTGLYYSFENGAWVGLVEKLKHRDQKEPGFLDEFWKQFQIELTESRHSSLWEKEGKDFEGESGWFSKILSVRSDQSEIG